MRNFQWNASRGQKINFIVGAGEIALEVKTRANANDLKKLAKDAGSLGIKKYKIVSRNFSEDAGFIPAMMI